MGSVVSGITDAVGLTNVGGQKYEARRAADQQAAAARQAAYASSFRPVGITSRFGTSQFTEEIDPVSGLPRVTAAGYTVDPQLLSIQDRLFGLTGGSLSQAEQARMAAEPLGVAAQGLFGLGAQYLGESPDAVRQRYIEQQTALLDPIRQREEDRLSRSVFGRGRAGLSVGDVGQPELFSLAQTRRAQDLQLAAAADAAAQQQINFGQGLFGQGAALLGSQYAIPTQALAPLQTYLGTIGSIEELGQQPFKLGMQVGGASADAGSAAGNLLSTGLRQSAQTRQQGYNAANQQLNQFMGGVFNAGMGMMSPMGGGSVPSWETAGRSQGWM